MVGTILRIVLGVVVALFIYVAGASMLRKFHIAPDEEPNPADVKPVNLHFRCIVCGAEVVMTAAQGDDPDPPRHCREDMVLME